MLDDIRNSILTELAKYTGKRVSWRFIKQTSQFIPHIERFHNLITGIFKPAWSNYALSIVIGVDSPYKDKDEVIHLDDGRWLMTYSPRSGGLNVADNRALVRCMDEKVPIGVFRQLSDKTDRQNSSTYRVLGLGLVSGYDAKGDVFFVESVNRDALHKVTRGVDEDLRYEVELYSQVMNKFERFVKEETVMYTVTTVKRDKVFREIVVREYDFTCAVCGLKFRWDKVIEATAAHIVPKHKNGTDDPRNGLSLCHTHHWAFDEGVFSLSNNYEVVLNKAVRESDSRNFALLEMHGQSILLPANETLYPHPQAIEWHREHHKIG